ncbi:MFS transporter [Niveispirillum sp.]|uniref:spinster family MFS transporter n=1 Tax=Niveispirillum sp. TaxID=1917217 RepID=UPI001B5B7431|nr:MFS transporter [Niveispirillum sp.]MBP7334334.1 MFS transporter [Niveispirillum sp.]
MTDPTATDAPPNPLYAYYVLFILVLIFVLNWIDRLVISILLVPIQQEFGLSDTAMGLLSGSGFAVLYAIATLWIARFSDRNNRRNLVSLAVTVWSVATSLCGVVTGFGQMLAARAVVGVAEAGGGAPTYSLIADYFAPRRRALAMGIYSSGIYIGIMLSFLLGSFLAERFGWRMTFLMLGPPGLLLALVLRLTVKEPLRGRFEPAALRGDEPMGASLRFLGQQRAYLAAAGGLTITAVTQGAYAAWAPAFLIKVHGLGLTEVGLHLGLVLGIAGGIGTFVGGGLSDWLSERNPRIRLYFPAIVTLLTTPFFAMFCLADDLYTGLGIYAAGTVISAMHFGPAFGLTQNLARPSMRGLATALVMVATVLTGQGIGPVLTGMLSDGLRDSMGVDALRYALAIMAGFATLGALMFAYGARFVAQDIERATGADLSGDRQ